MNPHDTKKRIAYYAAELKQGNQLEPNAYRALGNILEQIANGVDANEAFGLTYSRGKSESDDIARRHLSLVFWWISCAIDQPPALQPPYSLEEAFEVGSDIMRKITKTEDTDKYDVSYIKKCWYDPRYQHLKKPTRTIWEENSPLDQPQKSTTPND